MHFWKSVVSTVALLGAAVVAQEAKYNYDEGVLVLGDDDIAQAVQEFPYVLVKFYAPWCGHCKTMAPEFVKAAELVKDNTDLKLAKVDATVATKAAADFGVSGYPTLKFFKNGEASDYNGGRVAPEIVAWLNKKTGPSVAVATSLEDVEAIKSDNDIVVVIYATDASEESNKSVQAFTKVADVNDDAKFILVSDAAVAKELEITEDNSVVLFKNYDEGRVDYKEAKITKSKLEAFIKPHLLPYVVEFSDAVLQRLFGGDIKEHMIYFRNEAGSDADVAIIDEYREVAKAHQGELIFVSVDMDTEANGRLAEFFGIEAGDLPAVRIINIEDTPVKYKPPAGFEFNNAGFELFASKYLNEELEVALNSEEVPEDWDSENLKVLVGKNFKEVALDTTKNVFLMAHAPWCGHCKSLMPVFEELAEHYEDDDAVIIAKMDSTKNEVPEIHIEGFPTLKFFPSGSSEIVDFEGSRELKDLIDYVEATRGDKAAETEGEEEQAPEEEEEATEEEEKDEL